jgi:hypothetical protein
VLARLPQCGDLLVRIEERGARSTFERHYYVRAIPSDFGRAFRWEKFSVEGGETYHVCLDGETASCECKGFERWGRCKHVSCALALIASGKL